ncbi:MAG TPA: NAD(P)H-hydrate dehydratase, partial [Steroidobacteraceae bacterium]|nr:NAD(P)H-hydrate dehydratase [Steroidobacteraceae bacterium]
TLMSRAGEAALACLQRAWPDAERMTILCGAGNNAGDGYVLAARARSAGLQVSVMALTDPSKLQGAAAQAFAEFTAGGGRHGAFAAMTAAASPLAVDALLGTGIARDVDGAMRECIEAVNAAGRPVFALDLPSGLDADTGLVRGVAMRATRTLTFVGLKSGLFLGAAPDHVGTLEFAGLGLPDAVREGMAPVMTRLDADILEDVLLPLRRSAHKGEHGRVLVIGGRAMAGAARLAGEAALRTGSGIVTVATSASHVSAIVGRRPELIAVPVVSADELEPLLATAHAVAIGPGLGLDDTAAALLDAAIACGKPLVVDADALTLLSRRPRRQDAWILTPHPGEAARLLGSDTAAIQRDRLGAAQSIAAKFGGVAVLKGAGTIVCAPPATPWICDRGNPGMATAGSGDVLTGIVVALAATGVGAARAAAAGVWIHAMAGDRAAGVRPRGTIASDLIAELRRGVNAPWY